MYSWVAFHFIGFGLGSRHHADRSLAYNSQRSTGFLGLCLCDQKLGDLLQGRDHCQRALKYDASDPIAYFELGATSIGTYSTRVMTKASTAATTYSPRARTMRA